MNDEPKIEAFTPDTDFEVPNSENNPFGKFLTWSYIILPIWGLITWYIYINGSSGWLDRGYWKQLQIAANTTFPTQNVDNPPESKE